MSVNKRAKVLVEIVGTTRTIKKKFEVDESGSTPKVVLNKGGLGRGDNREVAEFDRSCLVPYGTAFIPFLPWLKQTKYKLIMAEGATKCVSFGKNSYNNAEAPTCTKDDVRKYGNATVLKIAGRGDKTENRTLVYIMLFVLIAIGAVNILISTGHLRF